jgi:hypothetical protein
MRRGLATSLSFWIAAIVVVAALTGCGGGGGESGSTVAGEGTGTTTEGEAGTTTEGKTGGSSGKAGSTQGKPATPTGGLSKAEFVKQANAICEKGKKESLVKMAAYAKQHKGAGQAGPAAIVEAVKAVFIPGVESQIEEIRALGAPPGEEAKVEDFLAAMEDGVDTANEASGSNPSAAFSQSFKRSAKLAHEYGLDGCAYG